MLSLIGAAILTGCGVSQSEHQRVKNELQQTKQKSADASGELDGVKQKVSSLQASLAEQDKTIQALNDSVQAAEASNAEKDARIDRLMNPEETALADADAAYKSGDKAKALVAYKAFVRDFSFSSKAALAQNGIKLAQDSIKAEQQRIAHEKWVAEAPIRAAQAAAALAAANAAQQQRFEKKWQGIEQEAAQAKAALANSGGGVANSPGHVETSLVQGEGDSKGEAYADAMSKVPSGHQTTKTLYSKWFSYPGGGAVIEHYKCMIYYVR